MGEGAACQYDIAIIGAGIVGMATALCFARCGQSVLLINKLNKKPIGKMNFPVSLRASTVSFLQQLGVELLVGNYASIEQLYLSSRGNFGAAHIQGTAESAMAYVFEMEALNKTIRMSVQSSQHIETVDETVKKVECYQENSICLTTETSTWQVKRCVIADGANSELSRQLYGAHKILAKPIQSIILSVESDNWQRAAGYIRQDQETIFGCIPWHENQGWIVATQPLLNNNSDQTKNQSSWQYLLNRVLSSRLGEITVQQEPISHLSMLQSREINALPGVIRMGNAAISAPPIGAQGLNLVLKDCSDLLRLQQVYQWQQNDPMTWQRQFESSCQQRHTYYYTYMEQVLKNLSRDGVFSQLRARLAWLMLGMSDGLQHQLESVGQGRY